MSPQPTKRRIHGYSKLVARPAHDPSWVFYFFTASGWVEKVKREKSMFSLSLSEIAETTRLTLYEKSTTQPLSLYVWLI